jgi:hypothetical protein
MSLPGFTAETSLYKTGEQYHQPASASRGDDVITPAQEICFPFCYEEYRTWPCYQSEEGIVEWCWGPVRVCTTTCAHLR